MKTLSVSIFIVFLVLSTLQAQIEINVDEHEFSLTGNNYKGLIVNVPEVFYADVKKSWVKDLESGTKSKVTEEQDGEISIFGANIKSISEEPINVYSQIMSGDSVINLAVAIEIKRGQFITKKDDKDAFRKFESYLYDFAKDEYVKKVKGDVKTEEKILQDIEKELQKLQNQKKKLRRDIVQYEQNIKDSEDALNILDSDLTLKNSELANLNVKIESETNSVVKTDLEEKLKEAKKERKKISNSISREKKKISDNKTNIENAKSEIRSNETMQETYPAKIQAQQKVVDFHTNKLEVIENY